MGNQNVSMPAADENFRQFISSDTTLNENEVADLIVILRRVAQVMRDNRDGHKANGERECDCCHDWFSPKRVNNVYCSKTCRQRAYRKRKLYGSV